MTRLRRDKCVYDARKAKQHDSHELFPQENKVVIIMKTLHRTLDFIGRLCSLPFIMAGYLTGAAKANFRNGYSDGYRNNAEDAW